MILSAKQIQEKCLEQIQNLYILFVDLTKAFDTVTRDDHWMTLHKRGCPEKVVAVLRSFHEGMLIHEHECGKSSEPFPVSDETRHRCVIAPTFFSIFFSFMLFEFQNLDKLVSM